MEKSGKEPLRDTEAKQETDPIPHSFAAFESEAKNALDRELTEDGEVSPVEAKGTWRGEVFSFVREFVIALIVSLLITRYVFIIPLVPTGSMIPTINAGERILVDKITLHFNPVKRGDIVVFPSPDLPDEMYVKRVVGMPGDTVEIRDSMVIINGVPLDEPYLSVVMVGRNGPYHVPDGCIFVLGDNRNSSRDSRAWVTTPYVELDDVQGRGVAVLWPLNSIRWLK